MSPLAVNKHSEISWRDTKKKLLMPHRGGIQHTRACIDGVCVDVCHRDSCGENAICKSKKHTIYCECPPEYPYGNPLPGFKCISATGNKTYKWLIICVADCRYVYISVMFEHKTLK